MMRVDALEGEALVVAVQSARTSPLVVDWYEGILTYRRFVVSGHGEEGSGSSKSANERLGGIGHGDLDSVEETPSISRQP
jgi:hypothetical protein